MRIATYNIHGCIGMDGVRSAERIAEVLRAADVDVACLQEVHRRTPWTGFEDQPRRLAELLGMQPVFQNNLRLAAGQYGNLVLTRLPVVSHASRSLPNQGEGRSHPALRAERRGLLEVVVQAPGGPVGVLTTHWSLDASDRKASAEQVAARVRAMAVPVALTGDFNARPGDEEIGLLAEQSGLADAGRAGDLSTFPADTPRARIDYVWLSAGLRCTGLRVLESLASDHRAVVAEW